MEEDGRERWKKIEKEEENLLSMYKDGVATVLRSESQRQELKKEEFRSDGGRSLVLSDAWREAEDQAK